MFLHMRLMIKEMTIMMMKEMRLMMKEKDKSFPTNNKKMMMQNIISLVWYDRIEKYLITVVETQTNKKTIVPHRYHKNNFLKTDRLSTGVLY